MTQYHLNFHHLPIPAGVKPSAAEFEAINKQWQKYIGGIASQGKFVGTQRLDQAGSIIGPDGKVTNAERNQIEILFFCYSFNNLFIC